MIRYEMPRDWIAYDRVAIMDELIRFLRRPWKRPSDLIASKNGLPSAD